MEVSLVSTLTPRVVAITHDPRVEGLPLSRRMGWNRVEELETGYIADVAECSGGLVRYQVVESHVVEEFPLKEDGFRYTASSYFDVIQHRVPPHSPDWVNYHLILEQFNILPRVAGDEIDEVWLFGFPWGGYYESRMAGRGAFWCNAPPLENTDSCPRRFVIMGFSYERGVGEMLEDLGHRAESILEKAFEGVQGEDNLWRRFTRYDKIAPGRAEVGTVHFAPNSERDYDWGNRRKVPSRCDAWLHFPELEGTPRRVNCAEWGHGDIRRHHKWWLSHLPKPWWAAVVSLQWTGDSIQ